MYFFLLFVIIITAIIIHAVSEFRKKAVSSGESELSITAHNILPASKICKLCSITTFVLMIFTGTLMLIGNTNESWNILSINDKTWKELHIIISVVFFLVFSLHLYTHSGWIKHKFIHK